MYKEVIITEDGSYTIAVPELNSTYHSRFGAVQESQHIFIECGLKPLMEKRSEIAIFEMGLGTGLNALLTYIATMHLPVKLYYESVETDVLDPEVAATLNYAGMLQHPELEQLFSQIHYLPWNTPHQLSEKFYFYKRQADFLDIIFSTTYNLIYFDAFAPEIHPALWTTESFQKMYDAMEDGGLLLTYCSKVTVRRAMEEAGFFVEKIPGPQGKREIVRATRKAYSNV